MPQDNQNIAPQTNELDSGLLPRVPETITPEVKPIIPEVEKPTDVEMAAPDPVGSIANTVQVASASAPVDNNVVDVVEVDPTPATTISEDANPIRGEDTYIHEVKKVIKEDGKDPYVEEENAETIQVDYIHKKFGLKLKREEDE